MQAQSSIESGATPVQHISAYEENVQRLARVKRDVVKIENVVLASKHDALMAKNSSEAPAS